MCRYILAYHSLELCKDRQDAGTPLQSEEGLILNSPEMSCTLVERLVGAHKRKKKTHWNIADQEKKFLEIMANLMRKQGANLK